MNWFNFIRIDLRVSREQTMYLTIVEIILMVALGVFQVYYLKKVLDNKRMIW